MKPLISIIIPVYNGEKEIESAVLSAVDKRVPMEILVVDDGSSDQTAEIVKRLEEKYPFVSLISQENSGPAVARNRGIDAAQGDYIMFLDSDDAFCPDAVFQAMTIAEGKDITVFGYVLEQDGQGSVYSAPACQIESPSSWEKTLPAIYGLNLINQVWAKVFSARLLKENGIVFPRYQWGEDRLFLFEAMEKASTVAVSEIPLCRYIQRKGSLISRFFEDKARICLEIDEGIRRLFEKKTGKPSDKVKIFSYMYLKSILSSFVTLFSSKKLSLRKKRNYVKKALGQKKLPPLREYPEDCGFSFRVLALFAGTGWVELNLFAAWGVHLASRVLPRLFIRAKHAYNKEK